MNRKSPVLAQPEKLSSPFEYYARLARVRDFVTENIAEPMSLATAAQVAGNERKYFSAFFKAQVGMPFRDWLRAERIDAAKKLLHQHNYQITAVARRVGYLNLVTFERAFKTETGLTPCKYKKRVPDWRAGEKWNEKRPCRGRRTAGLPARPGWQVGRATEVQVERLLDSLGPTVV